jgi:hypothetical protein
MTVQPYNKEAHEGLVSSWWEQHTGRRFQPALLPPVGIVGEDRHGPACACWLHLSAGVGVAFMENPVTRPGMGIKAAKSALTTVFTALEVIALTHDYGVIMVHPVASGQKFMESLNYVFEIPKYVTGSKVLR